MIPEPTRLCFSCHSLIYIVQVRSSTFLNICLRGCLAEKGLCVQADIHSLTQYSSTGKHTSLAQTTAPQRCSEDMNKTCKNSYIKEMHLQQVFFLNCHSHPSTLHHLNNREAHFLLNLNRIYDCVCVSFVSFVDVNTNGACSLRFHWISSEVHSK